MAAYPIEFQIRKPAPALSDFVESYWMLVNPSDRPQEAVILPDGRIDLFFFANPAGSQRIVLKGLESEPDTTTLQPQTTLFAASLTLLSAEYLLNTPIAPLLNNATVLPADFWNGVAEDFTDFDHFCDNISRQLMRLLRDDVDERKRKLFGLLAASNGAVTVSELAESVHWSSRQINRYFNQWFGLSLKAYCTILRFRASFGHIKEGKLFPEENFTDQAHFIHEVKKFAGVVPKELKKNQNDRFIQFSVLPRK